MVRELGWRHCLSDQMSQCLQVLRDAWYVTQGFLNSCTPREQLVSVSFNIRDERIRSRTNGISNRFRSVIFIDLYLYDICRNSRDRPNWSLREELHWQLTLRRSTSISAIQNFTTRHTLTVDFDYRAVRCVRMQLRKLERMRSNETKDAGEFVPFDASRYNVSLSKNLSTFWWSSCSIVGNIVYEYTDTEMSFQAVRLGRACVNHRPGFLINEPIGSEVIGSRSYE